MVLLPLPPDEAVGDGKKSLSFSARASVTETLLTSTSRVTKMAKGWYCVRTGQNTGMLAHMLAVVTSSMVSTISGAAKKVGSSAFAGFFCSSRTTPKRVPAKMLTLRRYDVSFWHLVPSRGGINTHKHPMKISPAMANRDRQVVVQLKLAGTGRKKMMMSSTMLDEVCAT